jgi:hypothetical protein
MLHITANVSRLSLDDIQSLCAHKICQANVLSSPASLSSTISLTPSQADQHHEAIYSPKPPTALSPSSLGAGHSTHPITLFTTAQWIISVVSDQATTIAIYFE